MSGKKLTLENVKKFAANAAEKNGWVLNPDPDFLESVVEGLYNTYLEFGYMLCPCREGWGERERDRDVICPCHYAAADVAEFGHCYCGLYVSEKFIEAGGEPGSIPERRPEELMP